MSYSPRPPRQSANDWRLRLCRGLSAWSARLVLHLLRIADRLERLGGRCRFATHLLREELAERIREVVRARDDGRDGATIVAWAQREADGRPPRRELPPVPPLPDQRPGCYYVNAARDGRALGGADSYLVAGPYPTHSRALAVADEVRAYASQRDSRALWMAWGTARTDDPRPTLLGPWSASQSDLGASPPTPPTPPHESDEDAIPPPKTRRK